MTCGHEASCRQASVCCNKEEEENGTKCNKMDVERLVKGTIYLSEEDVQDILKEGGAI